MDLNVSINSAKLTDLNDALMDEAREKGNELADMWRISEQAYHERRRQRIRVQWIEYFCVMAQNHAALSERYRSRAEELCERTTA